MLSRADGSPNQEPLLFINSQTDPLELQWIFYCVFFALLCVIMKPMLSCLTNASCLTPTTGTAPQAFAATLQYFAAVQCLLNHDSLPESNVPSFQSFDFIIIGGGTAGSVVANRLSEVKGWKILLLEVGGDPPVESHIPGFDSAMVDSEYNWKYMSTDNVVIGQGIINGSINLSKGKMFGGSSSLNEMHYIRGHDQDYQNWFDEGNVDWNYDDVHRCFQKAENLQSKKLLKDPTISKYYGKAGPLVINRFNNTFRDVTNGVLKSWDEIGFNYVPDLNAAGLFGSGIVTATASDGVRQSTNTGYLIPIKNRRNIKILKHAVVRNILITEDSKVVFGVLVEYNGKILTFYATHEVILSAGAVNSPQLLMLSGIGPKEHLRSKNITCILDSPMVGQNLQDHLLVPITIYGDTPEEVTTDTKHRDVVNYILDRTGRLAESSMFTDISAFYSTEKRVFYPECQLYFSIIPKNTFELKRYLTEQYRYKDSIVDSIAEFNENHALYFFAFNLLHPYSTGNISLSSNNPKEGPLIFTNYFDDSRDLATAVKGLKMASKVVKSRFFKNIGGILGRMKWPACDGFKLDSEEYWKFVCMNMVTSMHHLVGTCKMGSDPKTSVVDSRLRVHGVTHLRIIDASVMPKITSGSINAPSIMIGERGAEIIKEDYKNL